MSKADDIRKATEAQHENAIENIRSLSDRVLGKEAARILGGEGSGIKGHTALRAIPAVTSPRAGGPPTGSIHTKDVFSAEVSKGGFSSKEKPPYDSNKVAQALKTQQKQEAHLDPSTLIATQDVLSREKVSAYISGKESSKPVVVVEHEGKHYVEDGNHRVAAAILRGDKSVKVRLVHL